MLAEWLETDLGEILQGDAKEQMRLLRGRVHRMDRLLTDLLEYAKVGRIMLPPESVHVAELVKEVTDLAGIDDKVDVGFQGEPPRLFTARLPLKRVFTGLLSNVVRHHDRLPAKVLIKHASVGDFDEFAVIDDGPGIPEDFYDRVFEMLQTLKPRDAKEGSGMGLALVRRLVEWAGVQISLGSNVPRGLVVRFSWPKIWKVVPTASAEVRLHGRLSSLLGDGGWVRRSRQLIAARGLALSAPGSGFRGKPLNLGPAAK